MEQADSVVRVLENPAARGRAEAGGFAPADRTPLAFHQRLPGYRPTPLRRLHALAAALGVGSVWLKDESERLGLPSYKILGASWATWSAVLGRHPDLPVNWTELDEVRDWLADKDPLSLVAATDGNHGRAVARMARWLGLGARILVPAGTVDARIAGIASEGAQVEVVDGSYDDAVVQAASLAGDDVLVISDTAWPGYDEIPRRVIEGYSTIFWEIDDALGEVGRAPDVVAVQVGVGALAAAAVRRYRAAAEPTTALVAVEPASAACAWESVASGHVVDVPGPHTSIMAGLNCGRSSPLALPLMQTGIDVFVAVGDELARDAMRRLADEKVVSGESGAAGLAGIVGLLGSDDGRAALDRIGWDDDTTVLLINTEGATDPGAYRSIIGRSAEDVGTG